MTFREEFRKIKELQDAFEEKILKRMNELQMSSSAYPSFDFNSSADFSFRIEYSGSGGWTEDYEWSDLEETLEQRLTRIQAEELAEKERVQKLKETAERALFEKLKKKFEGT